MAAHILIGKDDPIAWTTKDRRCSGLLIHKHVHKHKAVFEVSDMHSNSNEHCESQRRHNYDEDKANQVDSAGLLIPSILGVDSVTERVFDQGKFMSLGPPRSHDSFYLDGEIVGGSFLLDRSSLNKRKGIDKH